jgi:hypothetical protein
MLSIPTNILNDLETRDIFEELGRLPSVEMLHVEETEDGLKENEDTASDKKVEDIGTRKVIQDCESWTDNEDVVGISCY